MPRTHFIPKPKPVKGLYKIAELATIAGCCAATIHRDIRLGLVKAIRSNGPGNAWLIPQGNAAAYLEDRKRNRR